MRIVDARNLDKPGHRIAGHSQVMFHVRIRGVLRRLGIRAYAVVTNAGRPSPTPPRFPAWQPPSQQIALHCACTGNNGRRGKHSLSNLV